MPCAVEGDGASALPHRTPQPHEVQLFWLPSYHPISGQGANSDPEEGEGLAARLQSEYISKFHKKNRTEVSSQAMRLAAIELGRRLGAGGRRGTGGAAAERVQLVCPRAAAPTRRLRSPAEVSGVALPPCFWP